MLPAAVALEIMSEATGHLWPGWYVVEVRDCLLLKGIELKEQNHNFNLVISQPTYVSNEGFEVNVAIQSRHNNGTQRFHYRSAVRLEQKFSESSQYKPQSYTEKKLDVAKAYDEWLFHGPRFQVIEEIEGMSMGGSRALLRTTSPLQWMLNVEPGRNQWIFDPALVDAAAQMAIVWARVYRNETALPTRFGRVTRYSETLPERVHMNFERIAPEEFHLVRANVYFADADNKVVLLIEDMECVSSPELNRLGGTVKSITNISA